MPTPELQNLYNSSVWGYLAANRMAEGALRVGREANQTIPGAAPLQPFAEWLTKNVPGLDVARANRIADRAFELAGQPDTGPGVSAVSPKLARIIREHPIDEIAAAGAQLIPQLPLLEGSVEAMGAPATFATQSALERGRTEGLPGAAEGAATGYVQGRMLGASRNAPTNLLSRVEQGVGQGVGAAGLSLAEQQAAGRKVEPSRLFNTAVQQGTFGALEPQGEAERPTRAAVEGVAVEDTVPDVPARTLDSVRRIPRLQREGVRPNEITPNLETVVTEQGGQAPNLPPTQTEPHSSEYQPRQKRTTSRRRKGQFSGPPAYPQEATNADITQNQTTDTPNNITPTTTGGAGAQGGRTESRRTAQPLATTTSVSEVPANAPPQRTVEAQSTSRVVPSGRLAQTTGGQAEIAQPTEGAKSNLRLTPKEVRELYDTAFRTGLLDKIKVGIADENLSSVRDVAESLHADFERAGVDAATAARMVKAVGISPAYLTERQVQADTSRAMTTPPVSPPALPTKPETLPTMPTEGEKPVQREASPTSRAIREQAEPNLGVEEARQRVKEHFAQAPAPRTRAERQARAKLEKAVARINRKPRQRPAPDPEKHSLSDFVRLSGGIRVDRDNANAGEVRRLSTKELGGRHIGLVNQHGMSAEEMAERVHEHGYFDQRPNPNDLLAAIEQDARGTSQRYSTRNARANDTVDADYRAYVDAHPEAGPAERRFQAFHADGATGDLYERLLFDGTESLNDQELATLRQKAKQHGIESEIEHSIANNSRTNESTGDAAFNPEEYEETGSTKGVQASVPSRGEGQSTKLSRLTPTERASYERASQNLKEFTDPNQLHSIEDIARILPDLITVGKHHIVNGAREFKAFSEKMIEDFGEKVRPYLAELHKRSLAALGENKDADSVGEVRDISPETVNLRPRGREVRAEVPETQVRPVSTKGQEAKGEVGRSAVVPPVTEREPTKERSFPKTLESHGVSGGADRFYNEITDEASRQTAEQRISKFGADEATKDLLSRDKIGKDDLSVGVHLLREAAANGDAEREGTLAEFLSRKLTEGGQLVQGAKMLNTISPEGALIAAQKRLPIGQKLTTEQRTNIKEAATSVQTAQKGTDELDAKIAQGRADASTARIKDLESKLAEAETKLAEHESAKSLEGGVNRAKAEARRTRRTATSQQLETEFAAIKGRLTKAWANRKPPSSGTLGSTAPNFDPEGEITKALGEMALNRVKAGVVKAEQVVDDIYNALKDELPGLTKRYVREKVSGYGKTAQPSNDPIRKTLRDLKEQMRLALAIEDVEGGQSPKRSGYQRGQSSTDALAMRRELTTKMRELGLLNNQVSSARPTPERRAEMARKGLEREIAELERRINAQDFTKRAGQSVTTPELEQLRTRKAELRAEYDKLKPTADPLPAMKRRLQTEIDRHEETLRRGVITPRPTRAEVALDAEGQRLKTRRDDLSKQIKEERKKYSKQGPPKPTKLQDEIARLAGTDAVLHAGARKILDRPDITRAQFQQEMAAEHNLSGRALSKNFVDSYKLVKDARQSAARSSRESAVRRANPTADPPEVQRLIQERLNKQSDLRRAQQRLQRQFNDLNVSGWQRAGRALLNFKGAARAFTTSLAPFHSGFRHLGPLTLSHPITWMRAMVETARGLSTAHYDSMVSKIEMQPNYRYMRKFKLGITTPQRASGNLSAMEEFSQSDWVQHIPIIKNSHQAFALGLDVARSELFNNQFENLKSQGYNPDKAADANVFNEMANDINTWTRRANLPKKLEGSSVLAGQVFFTPRGRVAQFKQMFMPVRLVGSLAESATGNKLNLPEIMKMSPTQRVENFRMMFGYAGFIGGQLALASFAGAKISKDLHIHIGNLHLDPTAGTAGQVKAVWQLAQVLADDKKRQKIKGMPISGGQVFEHELRSSLEPFMGAMYTGFIADKVKDKRTGQMTGSDFLGRPAYLLGRPNSGVRGRIRSSELVKAHTPMIFKHLLEGFDEAGGAKAVLGAGVGTFLGEGAEAYRARGGSGMTPEQLKQSAEQFQDALERRKAARTSPTPRP